MKTSIKIFTSILLIAVLSMALFVSASAEPYTEPAYNAAAVDSLLTIYGADGKDLFQYTLDSSITIGPGSTDSGNTRYGPVSAAQGGLNMLLRCYPVNYSTLAVDGSFGSATTSATKDFQTYVHNNLDNNVKSDGWIGPLTWPYLASCSKVAFDW